MVKKPQKKDFSSWLTHHTIHIALFALFVGLLIGLYTSFFFLESDWKPAVLYEDEHDHNDVTLEHDHEVVDHMVHGMYEVGANDNVPTVELLVTPDSIKGYNLHLKTSNFEFAPEEVNTGKTLGQGHAHLYIDGEKITRLYSPYYYLGDIESGTHEISVSLNTDDHFDYAIDGEVVSATYELVVK